MAKMTAKCTCCGTVDYTANMVKTAMPNRGGAHAFMCGTCASRNRNYHTSNNELQGVAKQNGLGCGVEWETSYTDEYARNLKKSLRSF